MSEDFKQSPNEPENSGSQPEQSPQEPEVSQPEQSAAEPGGPGAQEQPKQSAAPQYPPSPEYYAQPPQTPIDPYGAPPANYGTPPPVYTPPPAGYAVPPIPERPGYGYGYPPLPPTRPLLLGQAVRELPQQYKRILFKPGAGSFAEEQSKADWGIIWMQLLFLVLFSAITTLPVSLMESSIFSFLNTPGMPTISPASLAVEATIGTIFLTPLIFFAGVGIQYLLARAFKGTGEFRTQAYNQLLYQVPTAFIIALLYLIMTPFLSGMTFVPTTTQATTFNPLSFIVLMVVGLLASAVGIYSIVLNVFSIMAAHRLSGGRAAGVVLIPYAVVLVLYAGCVCASLLALSVVR